MSSNEPELRDPRTDMIARIVYRDASVSWPVAFSIARVVRDTLAAHDAAKGTSDADPHP